MNPWSFFYRLYFSQPLFDNSGQYVVENAKSAMVI